MKKGFFKDILRLARTVYSFKELTLLWPDADSETIKSRLNYYVQQGDLHPIRRGLYAKDQNYDRLELACKIYSPSYISFETVLFSAGMIYQTYSQIFVATYTSRTIECDNQAYVFRSIKQPLLTSTLGIEIKENYDIATPERAFLDILYLNKNYHFDSLAALNWDKVREIVPIYKNKRMKKIVEEYYASVQHSTKGEV